MPGGRGLQCDGRRHVASEHECLSSANPRSGSLILEPHRLVTGRSKDLCDHAARPEDEGSCGDFEFVRPHDVLTFVGADNDCPYRHSIESARSESRWWRNRRGPPAKPETKPDIYRATRFLTSRSELQRTWRPSREDYDLARGVLWRSCSRSCSYSLRSSHRYRQPRGPGASHSVEEVDGPLVLARPPPQRGGGQPETRCATGSQGITARSW